MTSRGHFLPQPFCDSDMQVELRLTEGLGAGIRSSYQHGQAYCRKKVFLETSFSLFPGSSNQRSLPIFSPTLRPPCASVTTPLSPNLSSLIPLSEKRQKKLKGYFEVPQTSICPSYRCQTPQHAPTPLRQWPTAGQAQGQDRHPMWQGQGRQVAAGRARCGPQHHVHSLGAAPAAVMALPSKGGRGTSVLPESIRTTTTLDSAFSINRAATSCACKTRRCFEVKSAFPEADQNRNPSCLNLQWKFQSTSSF